ncbi:hypothetical protein [Mucilaginibacter sp. HD30]
MKKIIIVLLLLAGRVSAQQVWTDHSRLLPDQLRNIPTAIAIFHDPTPVYPERNADTVNYPGKFIWKHRTTVSATQELEVVAAGSYIWYGDKGWIKNIELDKAGFAERFRCAGGKIRSGQHYTFEKNWRYGDQVYAGDALWFVLAKDQTGKLYKGIAVVETEGVMNPRDLESLSGKAWSGTLTYLDYGTNKLTPIPTELTVATKRLGVYEWITAYPKEKSHNSIDTIKITNGGNVLDDEAVKERSFANGSLKIVTEKTGSDNNKPARFRYTYLISPKTFSQKKEVCYQGQAAWFVRNELKLEAK